MRDLMVEPAWTEEDLGMPLPDSLHAVSVCLPTWDAIIGYEEGRDKVLRRMRTGYPRFFRHPMVERLFARAKAEVAGEQEEVIVLPSRASVQRAHRWVELRAATAVRIASFHGLQVLVVPAEAKQVAYDYWRLSGEGVSSRQAMDFLDGALRTESKSHLLRRKLAKMTGVGEDELFVYSSGMAAAVSVLRALPGLRQGKKTLQLEFPYVDCLKMQEIFRAWRGVSGRSGGRVAGRGVAENPPREFAGCSPRRRAIRSCAWWIWKRFPQPARRGGRL